jgi:cellulose synthase/poly-beta-1,6-N-acetylglucosamine synthase-like glycosyltransferase
MATLETIQAIVAGYATVWALYLLLFPTIAGIWSWRIKTIRRLTEAKRPRLAIIIPARNAAGVITNCIGSLRMCNYKERVDIYAVADHCTDDTAERAQSAGATALIRHDGPAGKTYALAWALEELTERGVTPDLYVIVDATAQVGTNFLVSLAERWRQGEDIITGYLTLSSGNRTWYARSLGLMCVHRNLQNWSRDRFNLSAMLVGCGMAYSRAYIQRFGWHLALPTSSQTRHPTEDWRHTVRSAEQGYRVAFAPEARIVTPLRHSLIDATKQGSRWERGRMINAGTYALRVLIHGLWQRDRLKICAGLDGVQPPVAILGGLSLALAIIAVLSLEGSRLKMASFVPLILVAFYGFVVTLRGRREGIGLGVLIWAPMYIAWRCATFIFAWGFLDRIDLQLRRKHAVDHLRPGSTPSASMGEPSPPPP